MKKIQLVMMVGTVIPLLFLLFSCSAIRKHRPAEAPGGVATKAPAQARPQAKPQTKVQVKPEAQSKASSQKTVLLAEVHKAAGVTCNDCHKGGPPYKAVPDSVCLSCHKDYNKVSASYIDPHNAHITYSSCSDCHHVHRKSVDQCNRCHTFNLKTP